MKVAQSCPTLCDPMDYTVHGILQARILEWVAIPNSRARVRFSVRAGAKARVYVTVRLGLGLGLEIGIAHV